MSHSLLDQLKSSITPQLIADAAKTIGEGPDATKHAIDVALPALLTGVTMATRAPLGLSTLLRLVDDPVNDGALGTQLSSLYQGTMSASPIYRLGSQLIHAVFGTKFTQMTQGVAALSGVKPASSTALVNMLAPHVLSVLGTSHRAVVDRTPDGFARFLERQTGGLSMALPPTLTNLLATTAPATSAIGSSPTTVAATAVGAAAIPITTTTLKIIQGSPPTTAATDATTAKANGSTAAAIAAASVKPTSKQPMVAPSTGPKSTARPVRTGPPRAGSSKRADPASHGVRWVLFALFLGLMGLLVSMKDEWFPSQPAPVATRAPTPTPLPKPPSKTAEATPPKAPATTPSPVPTPPTAKTVPSSVAVPPKATTPKPAIPDKKLAAGVPTDGPAKAAKPAAPAATATAPPAPTKPVAAIAPAVPVVPGVTQYFGPGKPSVEAAAVANPDYKPMVAEVVAAPAEVPAIAPAVPSPAAAPQAAALPASHVPPVPGTTSFYGSTPTPPEAEAKLNPDYKPVVAAVEPAPAPAPPQTPAPVAIVPGTTSFYGATPPLPEPEAKLNPEYKPTVVAIDTAPVAAAPNVRAPTPPGVTSYYGSKPAPVEAAAQANPAYKPAPVAAVAAPPAKVTAPTPAAAAATVASGVTTYFGRTPSAPAGKKPAAGQNAAAAPPVSAATCQDKVAEAMKSGVVLFRSGRADLTTDSLITLKHVAKAFRGCPGLVVRVEGHTDDSGSATLNQKLSEARAQTVASALTRMGVDRTRISSAGFGMTRPVVPNSSAANKAQNRRIAILVDAPKS